jgi:Tol biopolymer transport system component
MKLSKELLLLYIIFCFVILACGQVNRLVPVDYGSTETPPPLNPIDPQSLNTPQGRIVFEAFVEYDNTEIFVINADGSNLVRLTNRDGFDDDPAWSPDGTKIAFSSSGFGKWNIFLMNSDGTNIERVTDHYGLDGSPEWSPDGKEIVFQSDMDTKMIKYGDGRDDFSVYQLYIVNLVDGSVSRLTTDSQTNDIHPAWSPDGEHIIFSSIHGFENSQIEMVDSDGKNRQVIASDNVFSYYQPAWSPDGSQIVFMEISANKRAVIPDILIMDSTRGNIHPVSNLVTPGTLPSWSFDGQRIVFDSSHYNTEKSTLYIMNSDGSGVTALDDIPYPSISPDWSHQ